MQPSDETGQRAAFLLALDIGNTNVKCGVWDGREWRHVWRAQTVPDNLVGDYAPFVLEVTRDPGITGMAVAISSVVPSLTPVFVEIAQQYLHAEPFIVSAKANSGLTIALNQPEQVGADRLANAAAAYALYGAPVIVLDLGTATKFEVVAGGGVYRGGAIAPGIAVTGGALVGRTELLPPTEIAPPPHIIGSNTAHALQSGVFWGYVAMIDTMIARLKAALNEAGTRVIATGGLTPLILSHISAIDDYVPELTLSGIRLLHQLNVSDTRRRIIK